MPGLTSHDIWADVARIRFEPVPGDRAPLRGPRKFGSGRLLGHNLILTARHVLEDASGEPLPDDGWGIRLLSDRVDQKWVGDPLIARVVWRGRGLTDLALLRLDDVKREPNDRIQLRFGKYDSVRDLEGVWLAGFPDAARTKSRVAKEFGAPGKLRNAADEHLYRLTIADAPNIGEGWAGCSGGSVIYWKGDVLWILGVATRVPKAFSSGTLEVVPVENALTDRTFTELLAAFYSPNTSWDRAEDLAKLPGPYEFVGVEAHAASQRAINATLHNKSFYGRSSDLARLDNSLANERSVTLLRGEAGLGKSALAAHWAQRHANEAATTVLHHAFSVREWRVGMGTRQEMIENLVRGNGTLKLNP